MSKTIYKKRPKTLDDIRALSKETLIPADVAGVLGCDPYMINVQAKIDAAKLGFPVSVMGSRVKIPRLAFIAWAEGRGMWAHQGTDDDLWAMRQAATAQ